MITLLIKKGVIASFRNVDPYSGALKVRSTRSTRHCACETQLLNTFFHSPLLLIPSNLQKTFRIWT